MSEIVRSQVIGITAGYAISMQAREENEQIDRRLAKQRLKWTFKPSPMRILLTKSAGEFPAGLVLSVPHEIGRWLLHRRHRARIIERDIKVDAVIDGSLEEFVEAMELGASEVAA